MAVISGALVGRVSLVGFGVDSFIEVTSGTTLLWRMSVNADEPSRNQNEKLSLKIVGSCFLALAVYVAYEFASDLLLRKQAERSIPGILLACFSIIVMPLLYRSKKKAGNTLSSTPMHADAKQADFCVYLSGISLMGLLLNAGLGWWWADPGRRLGHGSNHRQGRNRWSEGKNLLLAVALSFRAISLLSFIA